MENITQSDGFVYLIQAIGTPKVKIGYSTDPKSRLKGLQTGSPVQLEIVGTWAATQSDERAIHGLLSPSHVHLEWFDLTAEDAVGFLDSYFLKRAHKLRPLARESLTQLDLDSALQQALKAGWLSLTVNNQGQAVIEIPMCMEHKWAILPHCLMCPDPMP